MATEEDLSVVLIEGTLVVADSRHVLDDNAVVRVLTLLVQNVVGLNHVIHDIGLGDFLGAELLLRAQVLSVIVTKVVVAGNGGQLDTGIDKEIHQSGLHLGLARLEVVATDVGIVLLSKLNSTRNKGVLGRAVDEGGALQDTGNSKDGGRRNLLMALLNSLKKVVGSVVDSINEVGVSLSVGSPQDNHLVKVVVGLEVTNILSEVLDMSHRGLGALNDIVSSVLLIGGNEVRVVDGGEGSQPSHLLPDVSLQGRLQDLGAIHGLSQVHRADVPAANDQVVGVDHGQEVVEGDVDLLVSLSISSKLDGGAHDDGAIVVGLLNAFLGIPHKVAAVGNDTRSDGSTIVTTPADKHHANLGNLAVDLEVVERFLRSRHKVAIGISLDAGGTISILGADFRLSIIDIGGVHDEGALGSTIGRRVAIGIAIPVRGARAIFRVGGHVDELAGRGSVFLVEGFYFSKYDLLFGKGRVR